MIIIKEFQKVREICMCNEELKKIIEKVHERYGIEAAICEIFDRRWSYVVGTENFISGQYKFQLDENYGIIYNSEMNQVEDINKFLKNVIESHYKDLREKVDN